MLGHLSLIQLPALLGTVLSLYLALYVLIKKPGPRYPYMLTIVGLLFVWISGQTISINLQGLEEIVLATKYQYFGILLQPVCWYFYARAETGHDVRLSALNLLVLVVPLISLYLAFSYMPGESNLLWQGFVVPPEVQYAQTVYGPFFWVQAVHSYLVIGAGCLILFNHYSQSPFFRAHLFATAAMPIIVLMLNALYLTDLWPLPIDPTPMGLTLSVALLGWAMHHKHFLDLTPITRGNALDCLDDAVFTLDYRDRIVDFNPAAQIMLRKPIKQIFGKSIREAFGPAIAPVMDGETRLFRCADSRDLDVKISKSVVEGKQRGKILIVRDVSEEMETRRLLLEAQDSLLAANNELKIIAGTDELTGLANRRSLLRRLEKEIARAVRGGTQLAVLFIDMDHFKRVNDRYGHRLGDDVLRSVAKRLLSHRRGQDIAARYGGEELALILTESSQRGSVAVAQRICRELRELTYVSQNGEEFVVTASIGIALLTEEDTQVQPLLERADQALYYAKNHGRDCVAIAKDPGFEIALSDASLNLQWASQGAR